jgi:hypothetical protein
VINDKLQEIAGSSRRREKKKKKKKNEQQQQQQQQQQQRPAKQKHHNEHTTNAEQAKIKPIECQPLLLSFTAHPTVRFCPVTGSTTKPLVRWPIGTAPANRGLDAQSAQLSAPPTLAYPPASEPLHCTSDFFFFF